MSTITALIAIVAATTTTGQERLVVNGSHITFVAITFGYFDDWVGIDNVSFAPIGVAAVPEPALISLIGLGSVALVAAGRRRKPVQ